MLRRVPRRLHPLRRLSPLCSRLYTTHPSLPLSSEEERAKGSHIQWLRLSTTWNAARIAELADILARTGARDRTDVNEFVNERDLMSGGLSIVDARRLLMGAGTLPAQTSTMMRPQPTLREAAEAGLNRGQRPSSVIFTSSIVGGCLLSFGGAMYVVMGGGNPLMAAAVPGLHKIASAAVFPVGISMVVFTGTDLLTSNMMYHTLVRAASSSSSSAAAAAAAAAAASRLLALAYLQSAT